MTPGLTRRGRWTRAHAAPPARRPPPAAGPPPSVDHVEAHPLPAEQSLRAGQDPPVGDDHRAAPQPRIGAVARVNDRHDERVGLVVAEQDALARIGPPVLEIVRAHPSHTIHDERERDEADEQAEEYE